MLSAWPVVELTKCTPRLDGKCGAHPLDFRNGSRPEMFAGSTMSLLHPHRADMNRTSAEVPFAPLGDMLAKAIADQMSRRATVGG